MDVPVSGSGKNDGRLSNHRFLFRLGALVVRSHQGRSHRPEPQAAGRSRSPHFR